jgi:hypothetical protein
MPSEGYALPTPDWIVTATSAFRSAVTATLEEVRALVESGVADRSDRAERLQKQLGPFAAGRIDATRLSRLVDRRESIDSNTLQRLERVSETLCDVLACGDDLFRARASEGGDLHHFVSRQLAMIGRAFAAGRIASAARTNTASGLSEDTALEAFPFRDWSTAERKLAPPLVVTIDAVDVNVCALAPFLDGGQKFLLVARGPCPPAPLVRLITPSIFVQQAHAVDELTAFEQWPGAGVAALVSNTAARFIHVPSAGSEVWQRLSVHTSIEGGISRLGGLSAAQQLDELRQLEALCALPTPSSQPSTGTVTPLLAEPVDRLAAWLLRQADLANATSE